MRTAFLLAETQRDALACRAYDTISNDEAHDAA